ncbi:MAG: hypothetical protein L3K18_05260 [Thermoplasmata archaeon]|nr:hypothetical protein [Thermoplasmata archaeon]MCI4356534.1 hypothetical protein [Thermoplasmata archaeon]
MVLASLAIVAEIDAAHNQPIIISPNGFGEISLRGCYAFEFFASTPGTVATNWTSVPSSTAYLVSESQFHSPHSPPLNGADCQAYDWGSAVWTGHANVSMDSLSLPLNSGNYFLTFVVQQSPATINGHPVVLTPDPWHWY